MDKQIFKGFRLYLPAPDEIDEFKQLMDYAANYYHYMPYFDNMRNSKLYAVL